MKQKVVVRFGTKSSKSRSKALTIAVGVQGVTSATLKGQNKDEMEVVGEGMDSVVLTTLLRKGVGSAELVSVAPAEEKKKEETPVVVSSPYYYTYGPPYNYYTNWVLP
ncbi:disease resistance protein RGA5-like [Diospyros lotus]|uniref:disease resistance protein RGA5-like n=1 Tax=Diospyros lotus TaxID=55363 RepID=UPI00225188B8|nr:disease resistance protein RGA5-like [Diospyros lotus]